MQAEEALRDAAKRAQQRMTQRHQSMRKLVDMNKALEVALENLAACRASREQVTEGSDAAANATAAHAAKLTRLSTGLREAESLLAEASRLRDERASQQDERTVRLQRHFSPISRRSRNSWTVQALCETLIAR